MRLDPWQVRSLACLAWGVALVLASLLVSPPASLVLIVAGAALVVLA